MVKSDKTYLTSEVVEEYTEEPQQIEQFFRYFEQPIAAKIHHFYISKIIVEPEHYIEMVHRIKHASPHDLIHIYLNTAGGHVLSGIQLISAMRSSMAHIVTHAEGEVSSLGTMLFLSGDEMVIEDGTSFMIHNHSGGAQGKGHEYITQATFTVKWYDEIAKNIYIGFLSEEEYSRMIKGEDFWFTASEVRKRLLKYVKYLEKQQKEKEAKLKR